MTLHIVGNWVLVNWLARNCCFFKTSEFDLMCINGDKDPGNIKGSENAWLFRLADMIFPIYEELVQTINFGLKTLCRRIRGIP